MKLDKLTEATMLALRGKLSEVKGSSKTYTCIEDRQNGDFCVGATMTAEEWGETAMGWADSDGWSDPEEPLLKNFKTEQDCINFIDDMWEITIVPSDSPEAKEFLGEARSHKEDNEKVAPRTVKNALGNDVETREMVDVSNPDVGNNSYKNEKGNQYWGTTQAEYASKRNKTGQKNEYGRDVYLAPFKNTGDWTIKADRMEPATATARYQYNKEQAEGAKERVDYYSKELKRVRSPYKRATAQNQMDSFAKTQKEYDDKAHQIYQDMKDKYNKKSENKKVTEATTDVNEVVDEYKKAYHKDLDLKTVPCVIARDKMLSGWGGAEGRNHYQVVLCADSTEAHNIAYKMQAEAKKEQLANVRVSFGVKLPSRASVAYCVGRYASAWNMGDSWYERYDTNKKTENKNGIMSFEDWVDYIDIKKEYPEWFKDKQELDRPFLDVINDHMEELERDYKNYRRSISKKKTESIKLENVQGNNQGICPKCGSMITNYGEIFWDDDGIGQVFDCTNPECKAHGIEYYNTTFDYIEIED